jgi:hypothetical protein
MTTRRTGIDPLAYMGVEASTPGQQVQSSNKTPTQNDYDFQLGTMWYVDNSLIASGCWSGKLNL